MKEIETARLLLRMVQTGDEHDMFEICSDEQGCLDDGGFHAYTEMNEDFYSLFEQFTEQKRYAIVLKEENKAIGIINMMEADRAIPTYEMGFNINSKYQRQGYAYEAISSVIRTWFAEGEAEMFIARHFPYNTASKKLIEKLGFVYEGREHKALYHEVYGATDLDCYYIEKDGVVL